MQPIILLAIVGIAGGAMSVGFLGNEIDLTVQQLGVGEATLETPISDADIDFVIARASDSTEMHNVISECEITAGQDIAAMSHIFCKLTDENGNVVAEGTTWNMNLISSHVVFSVVIDTADFPNNKVQNIHDVVLVVQGP
jgi:hypothetical protein